MKKQTQMLAVLSAAAFMALLPSFIGQPQTVYAAECGWTEEDGSMVFYDEDGELLTDTWRKEGNDWIYLNEDGHISKNQMRESPTHRTKRRDNYEKTDTDACSPVCGRIYGGASIFHRTAPD
ncbi:MAG: hypothetical protein IIV18_02615, partial [Lachnospiraceae bacterium]|nr:hypothetical protein [Lachnospiraceae bacterium]